MESAHRRAGAALCAITEFFEGGGAVMLLLDGLGARRVAAREPRPGRRLLHRELRDARRRIDGL